MTKFIRDFWRLGIVLFLLWVVFILTAAWGLELRRWVWDYSQGAHFKGDIGNAFYWGTYADEHGLFSVYDSDEADTQGEAPANPQARMQLKKIDYPPLRLTAAYLWYRWAHQQYPDATAWQDDYDFTRPLLEANTVAEGISAVLVFFIIWMWRRREKGISAESGPWNRALCGVFAGVLGAMMLWFNPSVIWDGHCWPQWDVWPVPCFLAALLLSCLDAWFVAGVFLAIGASLKGQILLGAPILLIWPIFRGYFGAVLRIVSGFLFMTALIALPWMNASTPGYRWLAMVAGAMICMMPFIFVRKNPWLWLIAAPIAAALAWPWGAADGNTRAFAACVALGVALLVLIRFLPTKLKVPTMALLGAAAIFALMPVYHTSTAWYDLGFKYGTEKYDFMVTGSGAYNIPRMLQSYWRWPPQTTEEVQLPFVSTTVTFTQLTRIVYFTLLTFCAIGASIHHRRRDTRFLAAMVAPWLLFFMILTQMHGRYTVWAAAICSLLPGVGIGTAILGMVVALVSLLGIVHNQLLFARDWSPDTLRLLNRLDPTIGMVLLLIAGILFYLAVTPRRLIRPKAPTPKAGAPVEPERQ